jgi:hypothetical protein
MFQTGVSRISMLPMNTKGGATRPTRPPALGRNAPNLTPSASFRLDQPSHKGSSPAWGETAWQAQVGTTRTQSRLCRDVPSLLLPLAAQQRSLES